MLGSIIGDVAGSYYEVLEINYAKNKSIRPYEERIKVLDKNVSLFNEYCSATDDSILTCAIYDAIKNGNKDYLKYLKEYGLREINLGLDQYGRSRFGSGFVSWLKGESTGKSFGNGASMRISPIGFMFDDLLEVKNEARLATIPSHDNYEAILCAEAVAMVIYMLRNNVSKEEVLEFIEMNYFKLDFDLDDLQHNYKFSSKSIKTVPEAFYIFKVSNDFEDAIRKSLSIGGDSDTLASIVGGISEAYYGIPEELKMGVKPYLKDYMYDLLEDIYYKQKIKKL